MWNSAQRHFEERLGQRFKEFEELVATWSKETIDMGMPFASRDPSESRRLNLMVVRTMVNKWSIEILTVLRGPKPVGFEELRRALKGISSRVLSRKLKMLENGELIERRILNTRPPRVRYTLTEKGLTVTTLGAPVLLYLRFKEGLHGRIAKTEF